MPLLPRLRSLGRNLFRRDRVEHDLNEELRATLDILIDEKLAAGINPAEARRRSLIELGGLEPVKERVRDVRAGIRLETLAQDVRYALRHIRRSPGFAAATVVTLALGIGANTAMLSVLNTLSFRRLAIPDPDGLFNLSSYNDKGVKRYVPMPMVDRFAGNGPFVEACGYNGGATLPVDANGVTTTAVTAFVTGRCFSVLGVQPVLGRALTDADAPVVTAGTKVVVISDRLWRQLFAANPDAVGQPLRIDAAEANVVGVLPPGFRGIQADTGIDIFAPPDSIIPATAERRPVATEVLGRLKPGVSPEQAAAQLATMWPALLTEARAATRNANEGANLLGDTLRLEPMGTGLSRTREQYGQAMAVMVGLTALLLVLACVNLGCLLLTRLSARTTELGVRLALGGSRWRIGQQMMIEGVLLSALGTLLAVPTAFAFVAPVTALLDPGFVGWQLSFAPDLRVLAIMAPIGLAAGVLMTALPMAFALRRQQVIRFSWDRTTTGVAGRWIRGLLVAQVALSTIMLIGSALLTRSLYVIQRADPGVRAGVLLNAKLAAGPGGQNAAPQYPLLLDRLQALPGVGRIAMARVFPRRLGGNTFDVGFVNEPFSSVPASLDGVSANFFEVTGIPLVAGRGFGPEDTRTSTRVVVISENLARALSPDGNVIGRRIRYGTLKEMESLTIVGVVGTATQGDLRHATPNIVYAAGQQAALFSNVNLLIEVSGDSGGVAAAVRRTVQAHGREFVSDIDMVDDLLAAGPARERVSALLSTLIGGLAVMLAVIGIHGVLAYSVSRRVREIGVRIALGANPNGVAGGIVREAGVLVLLGLALGLPAAFAAAGLLRSLLVGVPGTDAIAYAAVAMLLLIVGLAAGVMPARAAARVDPAVSLRTD
jgi:predicted permease